MPDDVRIRLQPLGKTIEVPPGTPLRDVLFDHGVEFPCGGQGDCGSCRVRVIDGQLPASSDEAQILSPLEIAGGWRLACRAQADADVTLAVGQWDMAILGDDTKFAFTPREGMAVAIDVGTTTLVAQLVDLATGRVIGVRSAMNPQSTHGADVMSRVQWALDPGGRAGLTKLIREATGRLVADLGHADKVREVVLVGNTVMHHLFCGIDVEPLSHYPFEATDSDLKTFRAREVGWQLHKDTVVQFLPCLGGFVGSDILAGILASGLDRAPELAALIDLGTNGEIVIGTGDRMLCASTAAGPAFEGGNISMGMRASTGAVSRARISAGRLLLSVIGGGEPRGICGSGLVDLAAAGLDLGRIQSNGRLADGATAWIVARPVQLVQRDVRELQLAKGAIAAGARILLHQYGASPEEVAYVYLAGAFGNYVGKESAQRIGLLELPLEKISAAGNSALLGAKMALFRTTPETRDFAGLRSCVTHVPLSQDAAFQDTFVDCMVFPGVG